MATKRKITSRFRIWIKAFAVWLIARVLLFTVRVKFMHLDRLQKAKQFNKPLLYAFWHGRQLVLFKARPEKKMAVMSSLSPDGEMQAKICKWFGLRVVRGSSSKGAVVSLVAMDKILISGISIGLAVDGPRGPAFVAKPGIVALARRTQSPIVPVAVVYKRRKELKRAWDRFQIPSMFTTAWVIYGEPLMVAKNCSPEQLQSIAVELSSSITRLTSELDKQEKSTGA